MGLAAVADFLCGLNARRVLREQYRGTAATDKLSRPSWPQRPHLENKTVRREGFQGAPAIIKLRRSEILVRSANSSPEVSQHSVDRR